jgi:hypothetical protein
MPKEYINWPEPEPIVYALTQDEIDAGRPAFDLLPPAPRVGIHWDGVGETVQLSIDIDWDVLQEMVKARQDNPDFAYDDNGAAFPNRYAFYTGALGRGDLQRLIKHTRRARDAAFGSDE